MRVPGLWTRACSNPPRAAHSGGESEGAITSRRPAGVRGWGPPLSQTSGITSGNYGAHYHTVSWLGTAAFALRGEAAHYHARLSALVAVLALRGEATHYNLLPLR